MKIQTYTVVVGNEACNARCPYCIAKMTPKNNVCKEIKWRGFHKGVEFAKLHNVSTVLLTGKGEPTLFPDLIDSYLDKLSGFPFVELQTNGLVLQEEVYEKRLKSWYWKGLTTVVLSVAHYDSKKNDEVFGWKGEKSLDLVALIKKLHEIGFSVRISCLLLEGYIDSLIEVDNLVNWAKEHEVEQLTIRELGSPENSADKEATQWIRKHKLLSNKVEDIREIIECEGTELMRLVHGATIYDYYDQNLCFTNALTLDSNDETIRQLIFFPDGHLRYDWQYKGAILL